MLPATCPELDNAGPVNLDVRLLLRDGEQAARSGEHATARACFLEAASAAVDVQLWRAALRCLRHALELDLLDREVLAWIARLPGHITSGRGWDEYRRVIAAQRAWPRFGCRAARVVLDDRRALVECTRSGPVLELVMREHDLVEVRPVASWCTMPVAMAMIVLRRALWTHPRERVREPYRVRVTFASRERVRLDEHGDWDPLLT